jgi:hypothetical protein
VVRLDCANVLAIGERSDGDVPISHHADGFAVFAHQHRADVVVTHLLGNGLKLGIGRDVLRALVHHVFDLHDRPPNRTSRPPPFHYFAPDRANVQWAPKCRCGTPLLRRLRKHHATYSTRPRSEIGDLTAYILSLRNLPERANS